MINRLYENLRPNWYWWIALVLFNLGDAITTFVFTAKGMTEGNPIWHDGPTSWQFILFKLFIFPCICVPLLALLPKSIFPHLLKVLTFVFLEVVIYNIVAMCYHPNIDTEMNPYSWLEMIGLSSLFLYGALVLTAISERISTYITKRGVRVELSEMMEGVH